MFSKGAFARADIDDGIVSYELGSAGENFIEKTSILGRVCKPALMWSSGDVGIGLESKQPKPEPLIVVVVRDAKVRRRREQKLGLRNSSLVQAPF